MARHARFREALEARRADEQARRNFATRHGRISGIIYAPAI